MRFKYEPMIDSIKRRIPEEEAKGRRVCEVLLTKEEWIDFKTESQRSCTYMHEPSTLPTLFTFKTLDPEDPNGMRDIVIRLA